MVSRYLSAFLLLVSALWADDQLGHSKHGEAFNEGPRQAAVLMEGMPGAVKFPITTHNQAAQLFFTQGVCQLHGYWYFEAERSFRMAALLDAEAAMPYWGMTMANVRNEKRAKGFLLKASALKAKASAREQQWIALLEKFYREGKDDQRSKKQRQQDAITDFEALVQDYPDDLEAKAFLVWKLYDAKGEVPIPSPQAVDALMDQIFASAPMHPAHHYRIHLWDDNKPIRALKSAALCGQTSPGIAHMWHMPGHTYSKLKRYDDAAWQQEAATRVDHAQMMKNLILPDQIHNYAHNEEWLIRTWNEQGRAADGIALAKALIQNPRHPSYNTLDKGGSSASYGRTRLLDTLVKWQLWDELLNVNSSPYLATTLTTSHEVARLRAVGLAHYAKGQVKELDATLAQLEKIKSEAEKKQAEEAKKKPVAKTDTKPVSKSPAPAAAAVKGNAPKVGNRKPNSKDYEQALTELQVLKLLLNKAPAKELNAALEKAGDMPKDRLARYFLAAGNKAKAAELVKQLPQDLAGYISQTELYLAMQQKEDAKQAFLKVQELAYVMDPNLPAMKTMTAAAKTLGIPAEWQKPAPKRTDNGLRPTLDSLGPVHWSPQAAPEWAGMGLDGKPVSSKDYAGKNTVLLFYVGHSCTHCIQQLIAFEKLAAEFKKAGLQLVAISPDSVEDLPKAQRFAATKGGFPFPLVAAKSEAVFSQFRAYDDFEKMPLHAVAFVDGQGLLRWLDVSYKPFEDAKFVLEESQRLLKFPVGKVLASQGAGRALKGAEGE